MATEQFGDTIVVLDTATGQVWSKTLGGIWVDEGNPTEPQIAKPPEKITLKLPDELVELTIRQRRSRAIPGSNDAIWIYLDDITAQQVLASVRDRSGKTLLEETSLAPGRVVSFRVQGDTFYMRLKEMTNVLIGEDFAVVEVASREDALTQDEVEEGANRRRKNRKGRQRESDG